MASGTAGALGLAAAVLSRAKAVRILTGCFLPMGSPPAPETDGPIGAAQLAAGLHSIGIDARVVTDPSCADVVGAALEHVDGSIGLMVHSDPAGEVVDADGALGLDDPVNAAVVSIERLGPTTSGVTLSMGGIDVSSYEHGLAALFERTSAATVGIGDGGNELGMGSLPRDVVAVLAPKIQRVLCRVGADHLVVSGVSNWGAVALLLSVAECQPDLSSALDPSVLPGEHVRILETIVRSGAIDGVGLAPSTSVDGLDAEVHERLIEKLVQAYTAP